MLSFGYYADLKCVTCKILVKMSLMLCYMFRPPESL